MALTWAQCKKATNNSGNSPGLSLFDRGYNGMVDYEGSKIDWKVYWSITSVDFDAETYDCYVYLFGRKRNAYSSQNDFNITFYYAGNSYTTKVNRTLNTSSGNVRYMTSHGFTGLSMTRSASSGTAGCKIVGASGTTDATGTWTATKTIDFSHSGMDTTITGRTTTSITARLNDMVTDRNFFSYLRFKYKKSTSSSYGTHGDAITLSGDSTAKSWSHKFDGLTPCTYYNLKICIGLRNSIPDGDTMNNTFIMPNKQFGVSGYTNAKVITGPTTHTNRVYNGSSQTGVSGGTGFTYGGTRAATNVGSYTATATPMAQYNWTSTGMAQSSKEVREYTWKITPKSIAGSDINFTLSPASVTYHGGANNPTPVVKDTTRNVTLVNGTDYTVAYSNNTNAGTGTATITGKGNYSGTKSVTFKINPKPVSDSTVAATLKTTSYTYNGAAQTPSVTVKDTSRNVNLTNGTDYIVAYSNNTNVGTAKVTITGKGNYSGTKAVNFTISPCSLADSRISASLDRVEITYHGGENRPATIVKDTGRNVTLTLNTDYSVSYANNINAGTATVTITGKGNYTGSKSLNFTILKGNSALSVSKDAVVVNAGMSDTVTFSRIGDGTVSAKSSNVEVATVSISGSTITIAGARRGNCTVTVTCSATGNYNASTKIISVSVDGALIEGGLNINLGNVKLSGIFSGTKPILAVFYGTKQIYNGFEDNGHTITVHANGYDIECRSVGETSFRGLEMTALPFYSFIEKNFNSFKHGDIEFVKYQLGDISNPYIRLFDESDKIYLVCEDGDTGNSDKWLENESKIYDGDRINFIETMARVK